jgi:hypothetical protein
MLTKQDEPLRSSQEMKTPTASSYFQQLTMYFRKKLYERLRSFPEMKICEINGQVGEGGR